MPHDLRVGLAGATNGCVIGAFHHMLGDHPAGNEFGATIVGIECRVVPEDGRIIFRDEDEESPRLEPGSDSAWFKFSVVERKRSALVGLETKGVGLVSVRGGDGDRGDALRTLVLLEEPSIKEIAASRERNHEEETVRRDSRAMRRVLKRRNEGLTEPTLFKERERVAQRLQRSRAPAKMRVVVGYAWHSSQRGSNRIELAERLRGRLW